MPYQSAAEHWADECERLRTRLQRTAVERLPQPALDPQYAAYLRDREAALRDRITDRLKATTAVQGSVPLHQLAGRLDPHTSSGACWSCWLC